LPVSTRMNLTPSRRSQMNSREAEAKRDRQAMRSRARFSDALRRRASQ
jgi:hypothetical protein